MDRQSRKIILGFLLISITWFGGLYYFVSSGPPPPPPNTIQDNVGVNMPSINAWDYFWRNNNLTAFFEALSDWLTNHTLPQPVWEETVEWGIVYGSTGDWFNHTLPGAPIAILLGMYPGNNTIGGQYVIPYVYDMDNVHWQLELVWMLNGTQCFHDLNVMYHMRWDPGPD